MNDHEKRQLSSYIPKIDLESAMLHDGHVPWYLPTRFCAIARTHHVYFRRGVYDPNTLEGIALLGHELAHVTQYRTGMTVLSYLWSCRRGYANSRYEKEAVAMERRIRNSLL